ncbi:MAG: hypothetical protein ABI241_13385 [Bacteroidia bacterium]
MKILLVLIEQIIILIQVVLLFFMPIESCRQLNCDGKMLGYFPIFLFMIFTMFIINLVVTLIAFIKKKFSFKAWSFVGLIIFYSMTFSGCLFFDFGDKLRSFEIKASAIIFTCNTLFLFGYIKLYRKACLKLKNEDSSSV